MIIFLLIYLMCALPREKKHRQHFLSTVVNEELAYENASVFPKTGRFINFISPIWDRITRILCINEAQSFNGVNVRLLTVQVEQQAKLKIISRGYGPQTSSSFQFKIGIEKR